MRYLPIIISINIPYTTAEDEDHITYFQFKGIFSVHHLDLRPSIWGLLDVVHSELGQESRSISPRKNECRLVNLPFGEKLLFYQIWLLQVDHNSYVSVIKHIVVVTKVSYYHHGRMGWYAKLIAKFYSFGKRDS